MTTKNFLASVAGPTTLDLHQDGGTVRIKTSPLAKYADVRISTEAEKGPVAQAVEKAGISEDPTGLHVSVKGGGGGVTITNGGVMVTGNGSVVVSGGNSYSSFSTGGGRVFINGVDVSKLAGQHAGGNVLTEVVLPYGSSLILNGNADIEVDGPIHAVDATVSSGSLRIPGVMNTADVQVSSGSARLGTIKNMMDVQVSSGSAQVSSYEGSSGRVSASSGTFSVQCAPQSTGTLRASVSSGSGRVTGSGHLDVRRSCSSGSLRVS